jgi:hypothetical protein
VGAIICALLLLGLTSVIFVNHSLVNFVCLIFPILMHLVVFGLPPVQRTYEANEELGFLLKQILQSSFEICYVTLFLPIKFIKSPHAYFDKVLPFYLAGVSLTVTTIVNLVYHLKRRRQEMRFNARMTGKWVQVYSPTTDESARAAEWK